MFERPGFRWLLGAIVALCIVALLAWARNDAGVDDRDPDPPQSTVVVSEDNTPPSEGTTITTDGDTVPPTT
jgi:hypothetical protein